MKIALDYDETYTEDPELFNVFTLRAISRGHEVKFVTWRRPDGDNAVLEATASMLGIDVVYCCGKAKMKCYAADVWIDDSPYAVVCHAKWADVIKKEKDE